MELKFRILLFASAILFGLGFIFIRQSLTFSRSRLVFCDVGQGDGILITSGMKQVVVDGGPGTKIVDCLGQKMPFWDRTIEMVVLTHPQKDHLEGLVEVLERYNVKMIVTTGVVNDTEVFRAWEGAIKEEGAKVYTPDAGDQLMLSTNRGSISNLVVLWPKKSDIEIWKQAPPGDFNETSIVMRLSYGDFCAYLTGDIPKEVLQPLIDKSCQLLKVSHHGSRTGTNEKILDEVKPQLAIIQVGRNSFGHPHKEVIDLLTSNGVKILRNDTNGVIEVESDGKTFKIKSGE